MQGRVPVGLGTHTDVNALGKNDGVALGSRRPRHKHTVINPTISAPSFSLAVNTHSHGGVTGTENQNHSHAPSHGGNFVTWNSSGATGTDPGIDTGTRWAIGDAFNAQSNIESAAHNHNIGAEAPGVNGSINAPTASNGQVGPQTGAEPLDSEAFVVVNFIIKT
jgi:hypothetical protein